MSLMCFHRRERWCRPDLLTCRTKVWRSWRRIRKCSNSTLWSKLHIRPSCQQDMAMESLAPVLGKIYCNVRNRNGEPYARKTIILIPFGLQKKFGKSYKFDIVNDDRLKDANDIFLACLRKMKTDGAG